ncbi:hypothetical protein EGW08_010132, partial [Elysia chlorotica]
DCPYGDTALLRGDGSTCAEHIAKYPSACYNNETREICCSSCARLHTGTYACPYGDRRVGCTRDLCDQVLPNGTLLAELCCGTCNYTGPRECRDVTLIDDFTCQERIESYSSQGCYNGTVAFHCCASCSKMRLDIPGCEYGDLIKGGYCGLEANYDYSGCTKRLTPLCCLTCDPDFRNRDGDPDSGVYLSGHLVLTFFTLLLSIMMAT